MNDRHQAAAEVLQELACLKQALHQFSGAGAPAIYTGMSPHIERIALLRTRSLPQISPEFVNLLLAHAGLVQATVAAALKVDGSHPADRSAVAEAHARMESAITALHSRCLSICDGGTIAG